MLLEIEAERKDVSREEMEKKNLYVNSHSVTIRSTHVKKEVCICSMGGQLLT